jgi:hypothetical protein
VPNSHHVKIPYEKAASERLPCANGAWFVIYQLKDYETRYGAFNFLNDRAEEQVRDTIGELKERADLTAGSNEQRVRDFYVSYMVEAARNTAGIAPLKPTLARIADDRIRFSPACPLIGCSQLSSRHDSCWMSARAVRMSKVEILRQGRIRDSLVARRWSTMDNPR